MRKSVRYGRQKIGASDALQAGLIAALLGGTILPASATTKGLNQIVTPDVQPAGTMSISVQQEDPSIGNRDQLQTEIGVARNFEVALFQGTSPAEQIFGTELSLVKKGPYLLSTGFINYTTKGDSPQPFVEAGFYQGAAQLTVGVLRGSITADAASGRTDYQTQSILGFAYKVVPKLQLQADYQSGESNFSTYGFTYNITDNLQVNPSLYIGNTRPYKGYGYVVLTYTIQLFK